MGKSTNAEQLVAFRLIVGDKSPLRISKSPNAGTRGRTDGANLCYGLITTIDFGFRFTRMREEMRRGSVDA
jgi:hypothetical protein